MVLDTGDSLQICRQKLLALGVYPDVTLAGETNVKQNGYSQQALILPM
jgi:hypothetical protein